MVLHSKNEYLSSAICPVNGKPFSSQVTLAARLENTSHWNLTSSSLITFRELPLIILTLGGPLLVDDETVGSNVPLLQLRFKFKEPARLCLRKEKVSEKEDMGKHQLIN